METSEGKFYDSVVKEVVRYEHAVLDYQETCFCSFQIFWKHGPLGGTISTANMDRICLITPTFEIHSALTSFLDSARREVRRLKKRGRMGNQDPDLPPGFYAGDNSYGKTLSRGQPSKSNKGKEIVVNDW
ncbi:hypothetical protein MLD38_009962 [Melastoma candidum]|uniref:Uncharacterized protein n=1 Tax=Melastoma candidum TaxID=119954 RepID=A0ACB9QYD4_9MYRT|nr:hypothetical protein MLD38_009962 [Melastoma candidum]